MGTNSHSSAGVYVTEIDLSQRVVGASTSIACIVGESHRGPINERTLVTSSKQFLAMFGNPDASLTFMHYCALAFLEEGNALYVTRVVGSVRDSQNQPVLDVNGKTLPSALYGGAVVGVVNNMNQAAPFVVGQAYPGAYDFEASDLFCVYAQNQGVWNQDLSVYVYPNVKAQDGTFYVDVYLKGFNRPIESFLVHLNYRVDGYGVQINIQENINSHSNYIRVFQNFDNQAYLVNPDAIFVNSVSVVDFEGGSDGTKASNSDIVNGWDLYLDPEQISINMLINGGYSIPAVQLKMDEICRSRMDCIAILDTPSLQQKVPDALNFRRNTLMLDSNYSALYSPDYLILDQYNDIRLYVPPSGHVAGAYARTDRDFNLWFAPAGMNRGKLNVLGVRQVYNLGDRDVLADSQINATRVIHGAGIKIWGADTLQVEGSALSNVSVRRLMIFLEKSLGFAALFSVFDPNDPILRDQLTEITSRFLTPIKNARGVYGFGVVCDDSNNPPNVVANGDLILDVYIDPEINVKRIHLNAIITKTGAKFRV